MTGQPVRHNLGVPPFRSVGPYAAYDERAIWGTGDTPMAARLDARRWLPVTTEDVTSETARLQTGRMTDRLRQEVKASGGAVAYFLSGNMLDLWSDE